jgi:serine/threonine-protein kinase
MYREITALETLSHPGIPRLLETNVRHFHDETVDLYFVSEHVGDHTLADFIISKDIGVGEALAITSQLANIILHCHENDVVHRDIKPDNIVIRNGVEAILVDFGMVHHDLSIAELETQTAQAVGNRFLILPEFQTGSELKRDPRSDVTGLVGILLYLLTRQFPAVLTDETGALPHQRGVARDALSRVASDRPDLLRIFDRGFQYNIDRRYQTCEVFIEDLVRVSGGPSILSDTAEGILSRIKAEGTRPVEAAKIEIQERFRSLSTQIRDLTHAIVKDVGPLINYSETGGGVDLNVGRMEHRIGLVRSTQLSQTIWPLYVVEAVGNEIVVSAKFRDSPMLRMRVPMSEPHLSTRDLENLRLYLLRGIEALVKS